MKKFDNKIYFKIKSLLKCKCQFFFPECKEIDQEIKRKGAKGKKMTDMDNKLWKKNFGCFEGEETIGT